MEKLTHRLIVVSFDAMGAEDIEFVKQLPAFREFFKRAAVCTNVSSVYPSVTYPAHASIVTGKYPKDHGVVNNTRFQPFRCSPDWFWQRKFIKAETFYDKAIENGMKVGAIMWPVTAKSKIHYNIPEIFANRRWNNQVLTSLNNGSKALQLKLVRKFGHLLDGKNQPALDNFSHEALKYMLIRFKPELLLVHFTDLDTQRHRYGTESFEAKEALRRHDKRLGEIIEILKQEDIYDETTLVLLGDHYQKDVEKVVYINKFFADAGFLCVKNGRLREWKAICKSCDGSAYIYINKKYARIKDKVLECLIALKQRGDLGIENIYTRKDAIGWGADPKCSFMIEAADDYYFMDGFEKYTDDVTPERALAGNHYLRAAHGYLPTKRDYQTVFMAAGPGIHPDIQIKKMSLIDEGPTLARLLGLELLEADGKILNEILKL